MADLLEGEENDSEYVGEFVDEDPMDFEDVNNEEDDIMLSTFLRILLLWWSIISRYNFMKPSTDVFDVVAHGAVGDGKSDDSQAFQKAWTEMCGAATTPSPTLLVPSGKTFLLKPVRFDGPCKSSNPHVQVLGNIVAPNDISEWNSSEIGEWIVFSHVDGLIIEGSGQIDGQGSAWWNKKSLLELSNDNKRPTALRLEACNGLQINGLKHLNSQKNHISINGCNNVTISNINITAPEQSPNTDGIDISGSTYIQIKDSFIGTGDDCVAINGGSSFINITNVACGPGHGISVGSLGKEGAHETVEEINVQNCNFTRTTNGARIKTWAGGSGYARKISFVQITLVEVKNPIIIDQYYCNVGHNCNNDENSAIKVSDVTYSGIHGTSANNEAAINLNCSRIVHCSNIVMDQINIQSTDPKRNTSSYCSNAHGRSTDTFPAVPCLS